MSKVLTFKVEIKELEDRIWRKIEITDNKTMADLAYTILATFDSLAYHLYDVTYKDKIDNLVIINPDNPSGSFIDYNDMIEVIEKAVIL